MLFVLFKRTEETIMESLKWNGGFDSQLQMTSPFLKVIMQRVAFLTLPQISYLRIKYAIDNYPLLILHKLHNYFHLRENLSHL